MPHETPERAPPPDQSAREVGRQLLEEARLTRKLLERILAELAQQRRVT